MSGVLLACWPLATLATTPATPASQGTQVQQLKAAVITVERHAHDVIEDTRYPAYSRVKTYLGVPLGNVLVHSVTLRIDGQPAATHDYESATAFALIQHGLAPLDTLSVTPGSHQLNVRLTYSQGDGQDTANQSAAPAKPDVRTLEQTFNFTKTDLAAQLVIDVYQPKLFAAPALRLTQWEPKS